MRTYNLMYYQVPFQFSALLAVTEVEETDL